MDDHCIWSLRHPIAESIRVQYGKDTGIPGSGWVRESGIDPSTDPTDTTLKFLVAGNQLYMAAATIKFNGACCVL
jgi:hypothetical protein